MNSNGKDSESDVFGAMKSKPITLAPKLKYSDASKLPNCPLTPVITTTLPL
jgi:hypothetical protein